MESSGSKWTVGLEMYFGARLACFLSSGKPLKSNVVILLHCVARVIGIKYVVGKFVMYPGLKV